MGDRVEWKREPKETSNADTNVDIELPPLDEGYKLHLQACAVEDETSAYTYLRIGYKTKDGRYHWWVEEKSPALGTLYWLDEPKIIEDQASLVIRFNGTSNNDVLAAYLDGWLEKVQKG